MRSRPTRSLLSIGATVIASIGVACSSPLAPEDVAGTYALVRIGAHAVPTVISPREDLEMNIVYDSVVLRANGTAHSTSLLEERTVSTGNVRVVSSAGEWNYRVSGRDVELRSPPCRPGIACTAIVQRNYRYIGQTLMMPNHITGSLVYERATAP